MTLTLADIKRATMGAPRIVTYGTPGIGKTTLAAQAPAPVFIQTEDGLGRIDVPTFPKAKSYADVLDAIDVLVREPNPYETVVLDSLDALEPLLWEHVCRANGKDSIEAFGFGKGYTAANAEWRNLLSGFDALRSAGKAVVLIAHSQVVHLDLPDVDTFDRYQMRLHKGADALVCDWADAVLFVNYQQMAVDTAAKDRKRGVGNGDRVIHCVERPAWRAKNRYGLPEAITVRNNPANPVAPWAEAWRTLESAFASTLPASA